MFVKQILKSNREYFPMNYNLSILLLLITVPILIHDIPLIASLDSKQLLKLIRWLPIILSIFESDKKWLETILKIIIILLED